jgi:phage-related protein
VFDAIGDAFTFVYERIIKPVMDAIFLYIGLWAALFEWLYKMAIEPILKEIGIGFEKLVENVIDPATAFMEDMFRAVGDAFKWVYDNLIQPALDAVGEAFAWVNENIIGPISKTIQDTIETVGQAFRDVFQGVSDFMRDIFNGLVGIVKTPLNSLIDLVNKTIRGINSISIDIPDWVPEWGGKSFGLRIPQIPRLAKGGVVMPQPGGVLANIAEGGQAEAVIPLDRFGDFGGRSNTYNITVNAGMGSDGSRIGQQIVDEILKFERTSGKVFARA